jgi:ParB/Sulfiredoxin domain
MAKIELSVLRLDFQSSECLDEEAVQEKMQRLLDAEAFEPIIVRFDGESYFVQDGFHRVEAARRCGVSEIEAEILPVHLLIWSVNFVRWWIRPKLICTVKRNRQNPCGKEGSRFSISARSRASRKLLGRTGGETGIRTLDRVSPIHAFQACAFSHSAISPR